MAKSSFRLLLSWTLHKNWQLHQLDITTAFLNASIDTTIVIRGPPHLRVSHQCYLLKKALYGLKQAPRLWFFKLTSIMKSLNLSQSRIDPCIYYNQHLLIGIHVDDFIVCYQNESHLESFIDALNQHVTLKSLGCPQSFLGHSITLAKRYSHQTIFLDQSEIILKLLSKFDIHCVATSPIETHLHLNKADRILLNILSNNSLVH